ncbi:MAG: hypothetical protein K2X87_34180 [Gemmataceae bacterium]|nr:hypothetical protein [Gemmataceae bacterium]
MRGKALAVGLATAAAVVLGCHHDPKKVSYEPKERAVLPGDEARFNDPPSAEYRRRPAAKDEKTLFGRDKMGGGPMSPRL